MYCRICYQCLFTTAGPIAAGINHLIGNPYTLSLPFTYTAVWLTAVMAAIVTDTDIQAFQRDGAVLLKGVFTEKWIEKLLHGIHKTLEDPSEYSENLRTEEGPGYYFNDYCNWRRIPEFHDVVMCSPAAQIAASLMGSKVRGGGNSGY